MWETAENSCETAARETAVAGCRITDHRDFACGGFGDRGDSSSSSGTQHVNNMQPRIGIQGQYWVFYTLHVVLQEELERIVGFLSFLNIFRIFMLYKILKCRMSHSI